MNVMGGFSKLGALCAGVMVLTALPAWAQKEELWLDSQSGTPTGGQMVLQKGKPYFVTVKGTYSPWRTFAPLGTKSGKPEAAPLFASPKGANKEVGADPEFIFAWPQGSSLEKSPEPSPLRNPTVQVSLDGGKTWKHPASKAAFDAAGHEYNYELMGDDAALQVRLVDSPASDNYGRLQFVVQPAEELWLESQSGAPVLSQMVLQKGKPYRITMKGTYAVWSTYAPLGTKSGKPEATPMFPSPKGANQEVGADPEFIFAWAKASSLEKSAEPAPRRNYTIEVSVDGGKTWKHPSTPEAFNAAHQYTYELAGDGSTLQVRLRDNPYSDNSGRVQIFLMPGA
jgi:hypothetical protein